MNDLSFDAMAAVHHPHRWRLNRAGIQNVWFYYDATFDFSGGRCIWRGVNGAGKSRAMEMLLPFLLDADRRRMDSTGSGRVRLEDLMKAGGADGNRLGYLWLEVERDTGDGLAHLTLGALIRFSSSTAEAKVWYFTTPQRVGVDLHLMDHNRSPLSRADLIAAIGADRVTDTPARHRDRVRTEVFGLTGVVGEQRFAGLMQLLHTLRAPDVGNRIDEGNLTRILSEALPPLAEDALAAAGTKLDDLRETRDALARRAASHASVAGFVDLYRRYAAAELTTTVQDVEEAAKKCAIAQDEADAAAELAREHAEVVAELEGKAAALTEREEALAGQIEGIRGSARYKAVADLAEKEQASGRLERSADLAWDGASRARGTHEKTVRAADLKAKAIAAEVQTVASGVVAVCGDLGVVGVPHQLPAGLKCTLSAVPAVQQQVRTHAREESTPVPVTQPQQVAVAADLSQLDDALARAGQAAAARGNVAEHRRSVAATLASQERTLLEAQGIATRDADQAEQSRQEAGEASQLRDEAAVGLAGAWAAWTERVDTEQCLGPVRWQDTALAAVLADRDVLTGDVLDNDDVTALRAVPGELTRPALDDIAGRRSQLRGDAAAASATREGIDSELSQLRAGTDPVPPGAPGRDAPVVGGVPLWRAVDFAEHVPDRERAGLEGALMGAGLLTASLAADGTLTAEDGQVLLGPSGPVAADNLSRLLVPDAAATRSPAEVVLAVLERIGATLDAGPVAVCSSGAWRNGPLRGQFRHEQAAYIGAAARQARREALIADLEGQLADLDRADADRAEQLAALESRHSAVVALDRAAPGGDQLVSHRSAARSAARTAAQAENRAREADRKAQALRTAYQSASAQHSRACADLELPTTEVELRALTVAAATAGANVAKVRGSVSGVQALLAEHAELYTRAAEEAQNRSTALVKAGEAQTDWVGARSELEQLKVHIGADKEAVLTELKAAQGEHERTKAAKSAAGKAHVEAVREEGIARGLIGGARGAADRAVSDLDVALARAQARVTLPGVWVAVTGSETVTMPGPGLPAADVVAAVAAVRPTLSVPGAPVSAKQVDSAIEALRGQLTGTYDVVWAITEDLRTVTLLDATGSWHVTAALATLDDLLREGRGALSERERTIFTEFVLGGVAEELGARLTQAEQLVGDMKTSLRSIRTQQGIGLTVGWDLAEGTPSNARALRDLVRRNVRVLNDADKATLIGLIKDLVDGAAALNPSAGYAQNLATALDYRAWHKMDVYILGPSPGQRRPVSPRSKLSQGEVRFVSYAALFAAMDAFLTGLPDTDLALRLVVLDDAFAKVDNQVVAQFLGLLVNLDLDFAMTGHGLWGTVPEVPALDVYEVRRREGGPAVTTHVHWDGHTRRLQPVAALASSR
ncbi:MAG: TIGR02680 family protein [Actinomycetales bacterium]|nr:TIGR02680 family protein [Actinomycetales bacterium]